MPALQPVTSPELDRYEQGRTLTAFQRRLLSSCREAYRERDDLLVEVEQLRQRVSGLEEYERRANEKPTVLLVHDLGLHGAVAAYERGGVRVETLVVYPWERMSEALASAGRHWLDKPPEAYIRSPYSDTLSATRALELESKRATIEGCQKVIEMKQAVSDALDLIKELAPYRDKYLQEVSDGS